MTDTDAFSTDSDQNDARGPAGTAADTEQGASAVDSGQPIDDGMGPDAPADVAGEDEPVDSDDENPLEEANRS